MMDDRNRKDFREQAGQNSQADQPVRMYDPDDIKKKKSKLTGWKKGLVVFLIVALAVVGVGVGCSMGVAKLVANGGAIADADYDFSNDYIGVLYIEGTMNSDNDPQDTYNQSWLLDRIEQMKNDPYNQAMVLHVNTPGGSTYTIDELYLAIMEYKEQTGRPVYTYMDSQATSGGYYVSAGTDKIYANRNCWTGSIGVTVGTFFDFSGFLEKMGVSTVTITSGRNKAMGSSTEPLTKEQQKIIQGLVDEAYDQFVDVVARGRDMKTEKVKKLADGRIYTARQAKENGLVDEVGTLEETIAAMTEDFGLYDYEVQYLIYEPQAPSIFDLFYAAAEKKSMSARTEAEQLAAIMEEGNTVTVTYLAELRK